MTQFAYLLSFLGTKQRLAVLVLLIVAPLVLLLSWADSNERRTAIDHASRAALLTARIGAERQSSPLDEAISVLNDMRAIPSISIEGGEACREQLRRLANAHPIFVSLGVMGTDGIVVCHNRIDTPRAFGQGALFKDTLAPKGPETFISGYMHGVLSGRDVIYVARPLRSPAGEKIGLVYAAVDLIGYSALADTIAGAARDVAVIESKTGIVIASSGSAKLPVGSIFPSQDVIQELRAHPDGGSAEGDLDGTRMIFGFAPLHGAESTGAMLLIATPRADVLAEVDHETRWNRDVIIGVVVLALCTAWGLAYLSQVLPTERLADLAQRIGDGDLSARHEIDIWQAPELRALSDTLNGMAARLEDASRELKASETRYRLLAENTGDLVTQLGPDGARVFASPASREVLGYEPEELMKMRPLELCHPEDRELLATMLEALQRGEKAPAVQYRARRCDGTYVWVESQGRPLGVNDGVVLSVRDISRRKLAEDKLAEATRELLKLATTDGLTGLSNRRFFDAALEKECARCAREGQPVALLLIDVDHFKRFNDTYGHQAGDECLKELSRQLAGMARRPADVVARYGGEELAVILPNTPERNAIHFAQKYRKIIESLRMPHSGSPTGIVTVSVGVAAEVPSKEAGPELLHKADDALYRAKAGGRNRVAGTHSVPQVPQQVRA